MKTIIKLDGGIEIQSIEGDSDNVQLTTMDGIDSIVTVTSVKQLVLALKRITTI